MNNFIPYPWQLDSWELLMQQVQAQRLPHALLVSGEQGCGKRHFVHCLVQKLLCTGSQDFACGECKSCQLLLAGSHPGFMDVGLEEKSKLIKVDQIRVLVDFIGKTVQIGKLKIAIIEPAEQMNISAANALLKCLEEPSGNSLIVLLTHAPKRLLPTIRSRCQTVAITKPKAAEADKWLSTFIHDAGQRQQLMMLANANPLLALEYADKEIVEVYLGVIKQLAGLQQGRESLTKLAEQVEKSVDGDVLLWLAIQQKILWQLIQASLQVGGNLANELQPFQPQCLKQGFQQRAYKMLEEIQQAIKEMQGSSNPNIVLLVESLLIRWQALLRA